jgi:G3E family GTPase
LYINSVVTIIDARHFLEELHSEQKKDENVKNEALEQVAAADKIIINKVDLVDESALIEVSTLMLFWILNMKCR